MLSYSNILRYCLIFLIISLVGSLTAQKFPDFPPSDVTREMDRDQMLYQMGIELPSLPPRLEDPNAPSDAFPSDSTNPNNNWTDKNKNTITLSAWGLWNNYHDRSDGYFPGPDSNRVGDYPVLNPLIMNNGDTIKTADDWWEKRHPEIMNAAQEELYGAIPPDSLLPDINWEIQTMSGGNGNLAYLEQRITGIIDCSRYPLVRDTPQIVATLRTPAGATEAVPVLVVFAGFGNVLERYWEMCAPRGWGLCTFSPNDLQPDNGTGLTSYLIGLVNQGHWRKPGDWGSIAAWSWGISRLIDYFENDVRVDAKKVALTGHSRYGKATLVTMAYEPRIALGFPSDGGSLGTTLTRRHWGQDLENSTGANEYHWMAGNFFKYAGPVKEGEYLPRKVANLTVDAHLIAALCAPRPILFNGGNGSSWTDPYGQYLTPKYATPVYELLGRNGLIMDDEKPEIDVAYIYGDLGYRYHDGGHTPDPEWPTFFEFARKFIRSTVLNPSAEYLQLTPEQNSRANLTVESNRDFIIRGNPDWLNVNATVDGIVFIAQENTDSSGRTAVCEITCPGMTKEIRINQASVRPRMEVSISKLDIGKTDNSSNSFSMQSNTAWSATSSEDWLTVVNASGVNNAEIQLLAKGNPTIQERSSTLTIATPDGLKKEVKITQQAGDPTLQVFSENLRISAEKGSSAGFFVTSNTDLQVNAPEEWITATIQKGNRFNRVTVTVEANPRSTERSGTISIEVAGIPPHPIKVVQSGKGR